MEDDDFEMNAKISRQNKKSSFYHRVSVHHFHVMKDQMACCCCVPLGMAYHIIACFEMLFMTFLIVQSLEYYYAAEEGEKAKAHHIIKLFYNWIFYMLVASISVYSVPRIFVYLFTVCRTKQYSRL
jgi:heme/copper-type cytochrome/quinol oxidase subunit 3